VLISSTAHCNGKPNHTQECSSRIAANVQLNCSQLQSPESKSTVTAKTATYANALVIAMYA
jgi:hypothetical protein